MILVLIITFSFLSILSFFEIFRKKDRYNPLVFWFLYICLSLIAGLRYGDRDYFAYIESYNSAPDWSGSESLMEVGYLYLGYFFKFFNVSAEQFLVIFAFMSVGVMFIFIRKYTPFVFTATLIYFSHVFILRDMLQIRSSLSIGIAMLSIPYIYNRQFWKTFFIINLAGLFHFVGYFFIVIYFLYPLFTKKRTIIFVLSGIVLGLFITHELFYKILEFTNFIKLYYYLVNPTFNYELGLMNPVLIKNLFFFFLITYNYNLFENKIPYFRVLFLSYAIACFTLAAFNSFAILAGRIGTLFSNVELVLIPSLLYIRKYKISTYLLIFIFCAIMFLSKWKDLILIKFIFE